MPELSRLWVGMLTRNDRDSGTNDRIGLTISEGGIDRLDHTFPDTGQLDQEKGQANLYTIDVLGNDIDSSQLSDSSLRIGIRGDDAWRPEHIVIWGEASRIFFPRPIAPVAIETDLTTTLSTDAGEGSLSLPIRLVQAGSSTMEINRLLLLMTTGGQRPETHFIAHAFDTAPGTNSPIELQIESGGALVVDFDFPDTPQEEQEPGQANLYFAPVSTRFTKSNLAGTSITLRIKGDDAWLPTSFFLFGLDDAAGRPERLVPLVHLPDWPFGFMSTDTSEGVPSVTLPLLRDPFVIGGSTVFEVVQP